MKLNKELVEKAINYGTGKSFYVVNDDFIVIRESDDFIKYIEKTKNLRKIGVNYCGPVDYMEFNKRFYFLEHRAHGFEMDFSSYEVDLTKENYLKCFACYMKTIRLLNIISDNHLDKFFNDIEKMREYYIVPDICSFTNLFYDEKEGFSFIDVYPGNRKLSVSEIFLILLNGKFSVGNLSVIPCEYVHEYNSIMINLYSKIIKKLRKYNYSSEEIDAYVKKGVHIFKKEEQVEINDLNIVIAEFKEKTKNIIFLN